jgi:hypothetical protein
MAKTRTTDLLVHGEGSIYLLRPTTRRGHRGVDEHIADDRQEWGVIVVEHRFIGDIVRCAVADGLRAAIS